MMRGRYPATFNDTDAVTFDEDWLEDRLADLDVRWTHARAELSCEACEEPIHPGCLMASVGRWVTIKSLLDEPTNQRRFQRHGRLCGECGERVERRKEEISA